MLGLRREVTAVRARPWRCALQGHLPQLSCLVFVSAVGKGQEATQWYELPLRRQHNPSLQARQPLITMQNLFTYNN